MIARDTSDEALAYCNTYPPEDIVKITNAGLENLILNQAKSIPPSEDAQRILTELVSKLINQNDKTRKPTP